MMASMEFDMLLNEIQILLRTSLIEKRDFYVFLCSDFIDLEELTHKGN